MKLTARYSDDYSVQPRHVEPRCRRCDSPFALKMVEGALFRCSSRMECDRNLVKRVNTEVYRSYRSARSSDDAESLEALLRAAGDTAVL